MNTTAPPMNPATTLVTAITRTPEHDESHPMHGTIACHLVPEFPLFIKNLFVILTTHDYLSCCGA